MDELQENVISIVREQLNKRGQPMDSGSRNLLKFLITVSGIGEVRSLAMQKLEIWLQVSYTLGAGYFVFDHVLDHSIQTVELPLFC